MLRLVILCAGLLLAILVSERPTFSMHQQIIELTHRHATLDQVKRRWIGLVLLSSQEKSQMMLRHSGSEDALLTKIDHYPYTGLVKADHSSAFLFFDTNYVLRAFELKTQLASATSAPKPNRPARSEIAVKSQPETLLTASHVKIHQLPVQEVNIPDQPRLVVAQLSSIAKPRPKWPPKARLSVRP